MKVIPIVALAFSVVSGMGQFDRGLTMSEYYDCSRRGALNSSTDVSAMMTKLVNVSRRRHNPFKAHLRQIGRINKHVDHAKGCCRQ